MTELREYAKHGYEVHGTDRRPPHRIDTTIDLDAID